MIAAGRGSWLREIGWGEGEGISTLHHRENQHIVSSTMKKLDGSAFLPARANAMDTAVDSGLSVLHDGPTWDRRRSSPLSLFVCRLTHHVQVQLTLVKAVDLIEDLVQRVWAWLRPWRGAMRTDCMVIEDVSHS